MPISVICSCGKQLRAKDSHAGRKARCPDCGNPVAIPRPTRREVALLDHPASPGSVPPPGGSRSDREDTDSRIVVRGGRSPRFTDLFHVRIDQGGINYYRGRRVSGPRAAVADSDQAVAVLESSALAVVSPDAILEEINSKRGAMGLARALIATGFGLILLGTILVGGEKIAFAAPCYAAAIACLVATPWARWRDRRANTTNLVYANPDGGLGESMQEGVRKLFETFAGTHATWCIDTRNHHGDWKRHGGAGTSVHRRRIRAGLAVPPGVRTNAQVGCVEVDRRRYYFFPDRILAYSPHKVESVSYDGLSVSAASTRFVESEAVPRDAQVVGHTWLFVNKAGGPDLRFKNNRQFPIALYGELTLDAGPVLHFTVQTSRAETAEAAGVVLGLMGRASAEMKSRPAPASPPPLPEVGGFGDDASPLDGITGGIERLKSARLYSRFPDWAQAAVIGLAVAVPVVVAIALLFAR